MEAAGLARPGLARGVGVAHRLPRSAPLAAIAIVAAALRLWGFDRIAGNPFYDAAVRSMSQSWHNLFFGAFEPGGGVAIDKAPVDLWLQVASVKLFGFSSVALRLPEALAGIAAVVLVSDLGRRLFGRAAGLAAAATLAVIPASVLTARSDTMDSVMMALVVLAAWMVVRAAERPRASTRWMVAAGAVLGIAFNVKLTEALLPLPALALLAWLALEGGRARRLRTLLAGGAAFVAVALAWLIAVALAPGPKPFPIGSTDGSAWSVVFGFNGLARIGLSHRSSTVTGGSGPLQLFSPSGYQFGTMAGTALVGALVAGGLATAVLLRRGQGSPLARAGAACLAAWLLTGIVVLSQMVGLHLRYLEAITPAVALALGAGVAALAAAAPRRRAAALALVGAVGAVAALDAPVGDPPPGALAIAGVATLVLALVAATLHHGARHTWLSRRGPDALVHGLLVVALVGMLAAPTIAATRIAAGHASDAGEPGAMATRQLDRLSRFLTARRDGARYEVATMAAAKAAALIAHDGQPVLALTSAYGLQLVSPHRLAAWVRAGAVRYVLDNGAPCRPQHPDATGCAAVVRWARAHAVDVGATAGVRHRLLLRLHV
jgi:4-amino-4-deoxy-L-arabinose transferase-like glycosyltransferase